MKCIYIVAYILSLFLFSWVVFHRMNITKLFIHSSVGYHSIVANFWLLSIQFAKVFWICYFPRLFDSSQFFALSKAVFIFVNTYKSLLGLWLELLWNFRLIWGRTDHLIRLTFQSMNIVYLSICVLTSLRKVLWVSVERSYTSCITCNAFLSILFFYAIINSAAIKLSIFPVVCWQ